MVLVVKPPTKSGRLDVTRRDTDRSEWQLDLVIKWEPVKVILPLLLEYDKHSGTNQMSRLRQS